MAIETLLGDVSTATFLDEYFHRMPFSLPTAAAPFRELGTWQTVRRILAEPDADVMVVRQGQRWAENRIPTYDEACRLYADGYTLLVRHAERHVPELRDLAGGFEQDFHAPVDVHLYCTPGDEFGFGWHYDAEDVFILQTQGSKEYSLRKNTVNPWPLVETLPQDMKFERELMPVMKCLLEAGDWLYIPNGYWHAGKSQTDAISLAVGVMSPTAMDALDALRQRLLASILWRQRLPVTGAAAGASLQELVEQYRGVFADLADDLARQMQDDAFIRSFLYAQMGSDTTGRE